MKRTLLLCFIHGFKLLKRLVAEKVPDDEVRLLIYPKYETKGDLSESTGKFLDWLKEKVVEVRKEKTENPWPPNDRSVGVVLVAHSMGGFVASDALFSILDDHHEQEEKDSNHVIFPLVQGILAFDTPYNGLARSMFVYGAFSQYQKVSNIWNMMSAASAGLVSARSLSTISARQAGSSAVAASSRGSSPGWKVWQNIAVRSGVVGAIAAGGVAAYRNRENLISGFKSLNRNSLKDGAESGYDALGQGLAYINRDNVGQSFAWLSSHLKFIGALMRQKEMVQRLERLSKIEGIGIRNFYTSLGENGYWTGGYFVPERTFSAIPAPEAKSHELFVRTVSTGVEDEVQAHMSMFKPETNENYDKMSEQARDFVVEWFQSDTAIVDVPPPPEQSPASASAAADNATSVDTGEGKIFTGTDSVPDLDIESVHESPLDIVAAAAAIPLPDIQENELSSKQRESYLQSLYRISQRAGSGVTEYASAAGSGITEYASSGLKAGTSIPSYASKGVSSLWSRKSAKTDASGDKGEKDGASAEDEMSESMTIDADDDVRTDDKKGSKEKKESDESDDDNRMDKSSVDNHRKIKAKPTKAATDQKHMNQPDPACPTILSTQKEIHYPTTHLELSSLERRLLRTRLLLLSTSSSSNTSKCSTNSICSSASDVADSICGTSSNVSYAVNSLVQRSSETFGGLSKSTTDGAKKSAVTIASSESLVDSTNESAEKSAVVV
ncbi:alpha beta-Hydrolase protein [Rutstroemia sp. NJR-2017a BBW]|nr:alpha beta-Hydrolase protein [Rutstroemia sp. NJR-2017a BBW]